MHWTMLFLLLSLTQSLLAQSDTLVTYYDTGEMSSRTITLKSDTIYVYMMHYQEVEVFDRAGKLVFKGYPRRTAGHASVTLTYHSNGGVKTIRTSEAPDAGIQRYSAYYELDKKGNVIKHQSEEYPYRWDRILVE